MLEEELRSAAELARRRGCIGGSRILEYGTYTSAAEIAEAEGVTRGFVNRLLRLTLLAPDIVEAILEGRQPKAMQLEELTNGIPCECEKQREALAPPERMEVGSFSQEETSRFATAMSAPRLD